MVCLIHSHEASLLIFVKHLDSMKNLHNWSFNLKRIDLESYNFLFEWY